MIKFEIYEISLAIFLIVCFLINLPMDFILFVHTGIDVLGADILQSFFSTICNDLQSELALDYCLDQLFSRLDIYQPSVQLLHPDTDSAPSTEAGGDRAVVLFSPHCEGTKRIIARVEVHNSLVCHISVSFNHFFLTSIHCLGTIMSLLII